MKPLEEMCNLVESIEEAECMDRDDMIPVMRATKEYPGERTVDAHKGGLVVRFETPGGPRYFAGWKQ